MGEQGTLLEEVRVFLVPETRRARRALRTHRSLFPLHVDEKGGTTTVQLPEDFISRYLEYTGSYGLAGSGQALVLKETKAHITFSVHAPSDKETPAKWIITRSSRVVLQLDPPYDQVAAVTDAEDSDGDEDVAEEDEGTRARRERLHGLDSSLYECLAFLRRFTAVPLPLFHRSLVDRAVQHVAQQAVNVTLVQALRDQVLLPWCGTSSGLGPDDALAALKQRLIAIRHGDDDDVDGDDTEEHGPRGVLVWGPAQSEKSAIAHALLRALPVHVVFDGHATSFNQLVAHAMEEQGKGSSDDEDNNNKSVNNVLQRRVEQARVSHPQQLAVVHIDNVDQLTPHAAGVLQSVLDGSEACPALLVVATAGSRAAVPWHLRGPGRLAEEHYTGHMTHVVPHALALLGRHADIIISEGNNGQQEEEQEEEDAMVDTILFSVLSSMTCAEISNLVREIKRRNKAATRAEDVRLAADNTVEGLVAKAQRKKNRDENKQHGQTAPPLQLSLAGFAARLPPRVRSGCMVLREQLKLPPMMAETQHTPLAMPKGIQRLLLPHVKQPQATTETAEQEQQHTCWAFTILHHDVCTGTVQVLQNWDIASTHHHRETWVHPFLRSGGRGHKQLARSIITATGCLHNTCDAVDVAIDGVEGVLLALEYLCEDIAAAEKHTQTAPPRLVTINAMDVSDEIMSRIVHHVDTTMAEQRRVNADGGGPGVILISSSSQYAQKLLTARFATL